MGTEVRHEDESGEGEGPRGIPGKREKRDARAEDDDLRGQGQSRRGRGSWRGPASPRQNGECRGGRAGERARPATAGQVVDDDADRGPRRQLRPEDQREEGHPQVHDYALDPHATSARRVDT
ncbi:hypothetical protein GCM10028781_18180 [Nostocoides australiense]